MNLEEKYRNYRKRQVGLHKAILEEFVSADFYAQAWSLAFNISFIQEDFQAWVHGPVIPSLYVHFREYGSANLPKVYSFDACVFEQEELKILDLVWSVYGKYDAKGGLNY